MMITLPELLNYLNNFISWASEENIERKMGLPIGASRTLATLSRQNINLLEQTKVQLEKLYDIWNNQTTNSSLGQLMLEQLKVSDQTLDQAMSIMTVFQTERATYEGVVSRAKEENRQLLEQARINLAKVRATMADNQRWLEDAKRRGDAQAIASFSVGLILNDFSEEQAVSNRDYMNQRLTECTELLKNLGKIATTLNDYRNLANTVDTNLEDALRKEKQALQSTSESLSSYYKKHVGNELTELFEAVLTS